MLKRFWKRKAGKFLIFIAVFFVITKSCNRITLINDSELIGQYPSPNGLFVVDVYSRNGGLTVDYTTFAIVRSEAFPFIHRMIYWQYHQYFTDADWNNNYTVDIGGQDLNIFFDSYKNNGYPD